MVDDLLDVSQMETQRLHLERKWIDPLRRVCETVDRLAYVMKDLHVDISGSSDLLPVFADPGRVEQILGKSAVERREIWERDRTDPRPVEAPYR
jgi:signal transduction histidine kinase